MHTHITKSNVKAAIRDDKAHMDYLKRDIKDDQKFHVADKDARQTRDEQHITNLAQDVKHDEKKEGLSRMSSPLNDFQGGYHKVQHAKGEAHKGEGPGRYASTSDDSAVMRHAAGIEAARQRDEARIEQQRADLMNYNPVVDRSGLDRASCGHTGKKRK
tara:strand:+ start:221 stop:697 length:477 start_codon:yes stop_codon:yes gene_type:complete